jgi:hypothetical protein
LRGGRPIELALLSVGLTPSLILRGVLDADGRYAAPLGALSFGLSVLDHIPPDLARAWQALAPEFIHDSGTMFELFNEPKLDWSRAGSHQTWAQGMRALIDNARSLGRRTSFCWMVWTMRSDCSPG